MAYKYTQIVASILVFISSKTLNHLVVKHKNIKFLSK